MPYSILPSSSIIIIIITRITYIHLNTIFDQLILVRNIVKISTSRGNKNKNIYADKMMLFNIYVYFPITLNRVAYKCLLIWPLSEEKKVFFYCWHCTRVEILYRIMKLECISAYKINNINIENETFMMKINLLKFVSYFSVYISCKGL